MNTIFKLFLIAKIDAFNSKNRYISERYIYEGSEQNVYVKTY